MGAFENAIRESETFESLIGLYREALRENAKLDAMWQKECEDHVAARSELDDAKDALLGAGWTYNEDNVGQPWTPPAANGQRRIAELEDALRLLLGRVREMPNPHEDPMRHYYNQMASWQAEAEAVVDGSRVRGDGDA